MTSNDAKIPIYRIIGSVIYDWLVLMGLLMIFGFIAVAVNHGLTGQEAITANNHLFQLYLLAIIIGYYTYFWHRSGQTVGMKAWRIRLQSSNSQPIQLKQALIRMVVSIPAYSLCLIGILWIYTPVRRTWQGIASNTQLIYTPKR